MAAMVGRKWGRVIHAAGHLAVGLYVFSTIFLVMKFHRHWDAFTLQFLHETNKEEAQSFLSAFLFDWVTLALLLGTAVFFFAEGWLQRRVAQLPLFPKSRWKKVALAGAVAMVGVNALFSAQMPTAITIWRQSCTRPSNATPFGTSGSRI